MNKKTRKLALNKETMKKLAEGELLDVAAGASSGAPGSSVFLGCPVDCGARPPVN